MRTIALCAGIGGIELGLSLVTDARPVLFVERDPYCQSVLRARWPGVPIRDDANDVQAIDADAITAGFPCQPWSDAGQRKGTEDERWLWPAIVEWIRVVRPRFVFLENVPGLLTRGGGGHVLGDLAALRFYAEWGVFSCESLGASHLRKRVFILGYAYCERELQPEGCLAQLRGRTGDSGGWVANAHGAQREGAGAGVVRIREQPTARRRSGEVGCHTLADPQSLRGQDGQAPGERPGRHSGIGASMVGRDERSGQEGGRRGCVADARGNHWGQPGQEPADGCRQLADPYRESSGKQSEPLPGGGVAPLPGHPLWVWAPGPGAEWHGIPEELWPAVEPGLCGVAPGLSDRAQRSSRRARLRALGNSVSPPVAAAAWRILSERLGVTP